MSAENRHQNRHGFCLRHLLEEPTFAVAQRLGNTTPHVHRWGQKKSIMVNQLLPLWYMELSDKERGSLCSPDQMVNVGGVQIPDWFWERAKEEAESAVHAFGDDIEKSADMQHTAKVAAVMCTISEEQAALVWPTIRDNFDEAFMMYYAYYVAIGDTHVDAFANAIESFKDTFTSATFKEGYEEHEKVFKKAVERYLKLREKADADA